MFSAARIWAIALVVTHVAAIAFVGLTAIQYEMALDGMDETLPPFSAWTFHAHKYTPLFVLFTFPALVCAIPNQMSANQRRVAMAASAVGLLWLAVWFGVIWLGMGLLVRKLGAVI